MTIKELVSYLCKHEGLKSQVKIGDMREIVGLISDLIYADWKTQKDCFRTFDAMIANGKRRAKRK